MSDFHCHTFAYDYSPELSVVTEVSEVWPFLFKITSIGRAK